jgi:6-pyruvoyl-tetrahydropterin synthase
MSVQPPKSFTLSVFHQFKASHTLLGHPVPHFHLWKLAAEFKVSAPLSQDRVIDLVFLQKNFDEVIRPLEASYLNETLQVSPTSENLCVWVWDQLLQRLPDAPLYAVEVSLCDLEGRSTGKARLGQ